MAINRNDSMRMQEHAEIGAGLRSHDGLHWKTRTVCEKYRGVGAEREAEPYEVLEVEGNIAVNGGIALLLDLLMGVGGTAYNAANSYLAVGSGSTNPTDPTQTALATQLARAGMESTFPSRASQTVTFKAVFNTAGSDGAWNEWAIFNNSTTGTMLNRKVASLGTKAGGTWTLTVTITPS